MLAIEPKLAAEDVPLVRSRTIVLLGVYQRNLVVHGGKTDGVALRASLRKAALLVGAGMDRIAHAWYVDGLSPLELAARARISLDTVGSADGRKCVDLLGG